MKVPPLLPRLLLPLALSLTTGCVIRVSSDGLHFGHGHECLEVDGVELPEEHVETLSIQAWDAQGLTLSANVGTIRVEPGERDEIRLTLHEVEEHDAWAVYEGGELLVRTASGRPAAIGDVRVRVATGLPHLRVTTGLGDVKVEGVEVPGELTARTGAGDVDVRTDGRSAQVVASSGMGDVDVRGASCDAIIATTGMGDVDVRQVEAQSAQLSSGMGDVGVVASTFVRLKATTGMGDVRCRDVRYDEGELDSGFGSVSRH